jgi:hypothetical protein
MLGRVDSVKYGDYEGERSTVAAGGICKAMNR